MQPPAAESHAASHTSRSLPLLRSLSHSPVTATAAQSLTQPSPSHCRAVSVTAWSLPCTVTNSPVAAA